MVVVHPTPLISLRRVAHIPHIIWAMEMNEGSCTSTSKENLPWLWQHSFPFELGPYAFFPQLFFGQWPAWACGFFGGEWIQSKNTYCNPKGQCVCKPTIMSCSVASQWHACGLAVTYIPTNDSDQQGYNSAHIATGSLVTSHVNLRNLMKCMMYVDLVWCSFALPST